MDGAHDMGGASGFGPVRPEPNEPVFHAEWERRAFAVTLAMAKPGGWNIDMSRFAREDRPPSDYLSRSYYQIWLVGLERLMLERDRLRPGEIEAGKVQQRPAPISGPLAAADRWLAYYERFWSMRLDDLERALARDGKKRSRK